MEEQQVPPKVSVLIVSSNNAAALRATLAALRNSAARETTEVVVVDNGSRDETATLDSEFPEANFLRLPRNFGLTKAWNIGIRTAKGEQLLLLPPGIEMQPSTVAALSARLEAEAEALAVCPLVVDDEGSVVARFYRLPAPDTLRSAWLTGPAETETPPLNGDAAVVEYPSGSPMLLRRRTLAGMNYIDQRYGHYWADADICYQIRRASKKILLLMNVRVVRTVTPDLETMPPSAGALRAADRALGAAAFAGKHFGWKAGLGIRLRAVFHALAKSLLAAVTFGEMRYEFTRLSALVSGQKIDGSQPGA